MGSQIRVIDGGVQEEERGASNSKPSSERTVKRAQSGRGVEHNFKKIE